MTTMLKREVYRFYQLIKKENRRVRKLVKEEHIEYDGRGNIRETLYCNWLTGDDEEKAVYRKKPEISGGVYKYKNNRCHLILYYDEPGVLKGKDRYSYDQKRRPINIKTYAIFSGKFKLVMEEVMKYDDKDRLIEKIIYYLDNSSCFKDIYEYNPVGRVIKHVLMSGDDGRNIERTISYYDEKGRLIQSETAWTEHVFHRTLYEYDDQGKILKENSFSKGPGDPDFIFHGSTRYEYDNQGRLEKKTSYEMENNIFQLVQTESHKYKEIQNGERELMTRTEYKNNDQDEKKDKQIALEVRDRIFSCSVGEEK